MRKYSGGHLWTQFLHPSEFRRFHENHHFSATSTMYLPVSVSKSPLSSIDRRLSNQNRDGARGVAHTVISYITFLCNTMVITVGYTSSLFANYLIWNVVLVFQIRDCLQSLLQAALAASLVTVEAVLYVHLAVFRPVYIASSARNPNWPEELAGLHEAEPLEHENYDSHGILKYAVVHQRFWNGGRLSFGNIVREKRPESPQLATEQETAIWSQEAEAPTVAEPCEGPAPEENETDEEAGVKREDPDRPSTRHRLFSYHRGLQR